MTPIKRISSGFTIVELLIVIVIIAILSTITVVAYNGVTDKARQVSILAQVDHYEKTLRMYKEVHGDWPMMPASHGMFSACLGDNYVATATMPANACWTAADGSAMYVVSPALNTALDEFETGASPIDPYEVGFPGGNNRVRGITYFAYNFTVPAPDKYAVLYYAPGGNNTCGRGFSGAISSGGATYNLCSLTIR